MSTLVAKKDENGRIVLPKQWIHWAKKAGLKPNGGWRSRGLRYALYLKGKSRHWRVNCHGIFECSCPLPHFDRWANSRGAAADTFPQNEKEFLAIVKELHEQSRDAT